MKSIFTFIFSLYFLGLMGQKELLQSGPMVGYSTMLEVKVWVQTNNFAHVVMSYWPEDEKTNKKLSDPVLTRKNNAFIAHLIADEIEPGIKYEYDILINGESIEVGYPLKFESQELWQWRKDASDFSFIAGSCFYVNEPKYDRPGTPYGSGHEILDAMSEEDVNFMLWLGDNTYLREVDWNSWSGIIHRNTHTRSYPGLQPLLGDIHHYAIWDDHDYGPNNSDRSYWGKEMTLEAFKMFWANPNYDVTGQGGMTGTFMWNDCQFFLLDCRWFRSSEDIDGQILGETQIEWLIEALRFSQASFKFICIGGQVLTDAKVSGKTHAEFELERSELLNKVDEHNISGVVFLTGDRHFSEITRWVSKRGKVYYDATCSSLTAGVSDHNEGQNSFRVKGSIIDQNNYTVFKVSGSHKERKLHATFKDTKGKILYEYQFDFSNDDGDH